MDDCKLQEWVERISSVYFGRPFLHKATFNARLRSTGGRYFTKSHNIEISPLHLEHHGQEEVESIIKHELCHYHLHLARKGYQHRDRDFKELLAQVGGSRYCRSLPIPKRAQPFRFVMICGACGMEYRRKRRLDPRKYACGRCKGKLKLFELAPASE